MRFYIFATFIFTCTSLLALDVMEYSTYEKDKFEKYFKTSHSLTNTNIDEENLKELEEIYVVSEKFDGVRGVWDGKNLQTKHNNPINAPKCFLEKLPDIPLDGELWLGYGSFEAMQSLATRQNNECKDWEKVKYLIFDTTECATCTLLNRLAIVESKLKPSSNIILIEQKILYKVSDLDEMLNAVKKHNGEGLIVRKNTRGYIQGRVSDSFKLKPFTDAECKIVDYSKGKGKNKDKVGAFICEDEKNIRFKIGSGLSDKIRANPPAIGTTITYKYNGFTKNGIPKHTKFMRIREDGI